MRTDTAEHYNRTAERYDDNWEHTASYVQWMNEQIAECLAVTAGDRVADIGSGTGLFLKGLLPDTDPARPILCLDPSQAMLTQLPDDDRMRPVCASAEDAATGRVDLPYGELDAILMKEAIHHVEDIPATMRGLAGLLAPGGRILVITLPPRLDYPLFDAALERFEARQPEPADIARAMSDAGLSVTESLREFEATVDPDHYRELVGKRWMSVLATFSDAELADGLEEMRRKHSGQAELRYTDRSAFILGRRP
ncbi:MAG: class I SAM-dependent methyltransferase [Nocardiopsaceae bacterium]|nr:class I SAM-dependent methyltransferase [Nocardiopsaceae bacterium]